MIGHLTTVRIVDNSGAVEGRCIRVYGKKEKGKIGDRVLVAITAIAKGGDRTIKKGDKYKALIVRCGLDQAGVRLPQPSLGHTRWDENAVILVKGDDVHALAPIGSRIKGPISSSPLINDKVLSIAGPVRIP